MAEQPTQEEKMAFARAAVPLSAMADQTLTHVVAVIWSQLELISPALAAPGASAAAGPAMLDMVITEDPALQKEVDEWNAAGSVLIAKIHASKLRAAPKPEPVA